MKYRYYQPSIEEFSIGFPYEQFEDYDYLPEKKWHELVYGVNGTDDPENMTYPTTSGIKSGKIRVRELHHQDFIDLGYEENKDKSSKNAIYFKVYEKRHVSGRITEISHMRTPREPFQNRIKVAWYEIGSKPFFDMASGYFIIKNVFELKRLFTQIPAEL